MQKLEVVGGPLASLHLFKGGAYASLDAPAHPLTAATGEYYWESRAPLRAFLLGLQGSVATMSECEKQAEVLQPLDPALL